MNSYTSINRHKYYLKAHLVFVCKYRKQLLANNNIDAKVKEIFRYIESTSDFIIDIMETDKDNNVNINFTKNANLIFTNFAN